MSASISVVIPVHNAAASLGRCLGALKTSTFQNFECVVVDDGSTDDSAALAAASGARVIATGGQRGPAYARNRGVEAAKGEILFFIDADVMVQSGTLAQVANAFEENAALDALIGSYDEEPAEPNFLSQYKNLMHCFVHQHGRRRASTFWTGCGAIRKCAFEEFGGFDESYVRPSIEDIELGARLVRAGKSIELEPTLMVKHLKRWTLPGLLTSDIRDRAIPWTVLMLRERNIPNDLNVQSSQRISVVLVYLALLLAPFYWPVPAISLIVTIVLNHRFYGFLARKRGLWFAIRAVPLHLAYFLYSGASFVVGCVKALRAGLQ
ncbi:MAG TPA: glycosyltransferase family A protein [Bryobacteraceae bacterium]